MLKKIFRMLPLLLAVSVAEAQKEKVPAFPGAEGYGRYVTGGRGGKVTCDYTLDGRLAGTDAEALPKGIYMSFASSFSMPSLSFFAALNNSSEDDRTKNLNTSAQLFLLTFTDPSLLLFAIGSSKTSFDSL